MGPIMLDLQGLEITPEELELLQHPKVGGVILFSRNYAEPNQLIHLIRSIRKATRTQLLIAVDHEGGRVQRFRKGFCPLPALNMIGQLYDANPEHGVFFAMQHAWLMASELLAVDIDFSFAPVLDLAKNISTVIGDRAFHAHPKKVAMLAKTYITGMNWAGMATVGKHFPGHGSIAADSHIEIPIDTRRMEIIIREDLTPFIECSAHLTAIMPAHVIYSDIDPLPVGFSEFWLQTVLRKQMKFKGAIFSDDLSMQGASVIGDLPARAFRALEAGCDMILVCNNRAGVIGILEELEALRFPLQLESKARLQKMVGKRTVTRGELMESLVWQQTVDFFQELTAEESV